MIFRRAGRHSAWATSFLMLLLVCSSNAFGNRVARTVNGVTTKYLVEDDLNPTGYPQVLDELTGSTVTRTYTYGLQRISQNQIVNGAWTTSFYGYDGGGNVRSLTNTAGAITDEYEYDAFGNSFTKVGTTPNNYLYRGEQYDPDLGLYYLRARYYNAETGRFMSRDPESGKPIYPRTLHKYLYAGGDPVDGWDPTGREEEEYVAPFPEVLASIRRGTYLVKATWFVACVAVYTELWSEYAMFGPGEAGGEAVAYCKILLGI